MIQKFLFLVTFFFAISCGTDSVDIVEPDTQTDDEVVLEDDKPDDEEREEEISSIEDLIVYGKIKDQSSGNLRNSIYVYNYATKETSSTLINLFDDFGFPENANIRFNGTNTGAIFFNWEDNVANGGRDYFPYFKNLNTGTSVKFENFFLEDKPLYFSDYKEDLLTIYIDYSSANTTENSFDLVFKTFNSLDFQEKNIELGEYRIGENFKALMSNNRLFIYHETDYTGEAEASLTVIDLENFEIIDRIADINTSRFQMVKATNGNCFIFFEDETLEYDVNTKTLNSSEGHQLDFLNHQGLGVNEMLLVHDENFHFYRIGPSPGPLFVPAIYNLETKEYNIIDISEELTQFENDVYEWYPSIQAFTVDVERELYYFGVSGIGLPPLNASYGIFAVDFEGKIVEKKKIPISPIQIFN